MSTDGWWVVGMGALVAVLCAALGTFLYLRRLSMLGDAISHAVLPGIVLAYFISGARESVGLLLGAALFGLLVTYLIDWLTEKAGMQQDASIGLSFTLLFSLGIVLVSVWASRVDIDADCVLYGDIALLPFDTWSWKGQSMGPRHFSMLLGLDVLVGLLLWRGYKGMQLLAFDRVFAASTGMAVGLWHWLLMGGVSLATVFSFEAVGAILVVAFLVIPPAIGHLWSFGSLPRMLTIAMLAGVVSSFLGYGLAVWLDSSIAACMSTAALLLYGLSWIIHPQRGGLALLLKKRRVPHAPMMGRMR